MSAAVSARPAARPSFSLLRSSEPPPHTPILIYFFNSLSSFTSPLRLLRKALAMLARGLATIKVANVLGQIETWCDESGGLMGGGAPHARRRARSKDGATRTATCTDSS